MRADTVYGGAANIEIPANAQGLRDLGELRLTAEPIAVVARVVDIEGKPIAGVTVRMKPTRAPDRGDSERLRPSDVSQERPLTHQATTDSEGRFVFRELSPAAMTGMLEVADGAWLPALGLRLPVGSVERRLVVQQPGRLHLTFARKPPRNLVVEVRHDDSTWQVPFDVDATTGERSASLSPGRYEIAVRVGRRDPLVIKGIEVPPGAACDDARLRDIDWARGLRVATVHLRAPDGRPGR
ncbi:MAG: hypothetical protein ABIP94_25870, partial [Planctomycetota bacterium]